MSSSSAPVRLADGGCGILWWIEQWDDRERYAPRTSLRRGHVYWPRARAFFEVVIDSNDVGLFSGQTASNTAQILYRADTLRWHGVQSVLNDDLPLLKGVLVEDGSIMSYTATITSNEVMLKVHFACSADPRHDSFHRTTAWTLETGSVGVPASLMQMIQPFQLYHGLVHRSNEEGLALHGRELEISEYPAMKQLDESTTKVYKEKMNCIYHEMDVEALRVAAAKERLMKSQTPPAVRPSLPAPASQPFTTADFSRPFGVTAVPPRQYSPPNMTEKTYGGRLLEQNGLPPIVQQPLPQTIQLKGENLNIYQRYNNFLKDKRNHLVVVYKISRDSFGLAFCPRIGTIRLNSLSLNNSPSTVLQVNQWIDVRVDIKKNAMLGKSETVCYSEKILSIRDPLLVSHVVRGCIQFEITVDPHNAYEENNCMFVIHDIVNIVYFSPSFWRECEGLTCVSVLVEHNQRCPDYFCDVMVVEVLAVKKGDIEQLEKKWRSQLLPVAEMHAADTEDGVGDNREHEPVLRCDFDDDDFDEDDEDDDVTHLALTAKLNAQRHVQQRQPQQMPSRFSGPGIEQRAPFRSDSDGYRNVESGSNLPPRSFSSDPPRGAARPQPEYPARLSPERLRELESRAGFSEDRMAAPMHGVQGLIIQSNEEFSYFYSTDHQLAVYQGNIQDGNMSLGDSVIYSQQPLALPKYHAKFELIHPPAPKVAAVPLPIKCLPCGDFILIESRVHFTRATAESDDMGDIKLEDGTVKDRENRVVPVRAIEGQSHMARLEPRILTNGHADWRIRYLNATIKGLQAQFEEEEDEIDQQKRLNKEREKRESRPPSSSSPAQGGVRGAEFSRAGASVMHPSPSAPHPSSSARIAGPSRKLMSSTRGAVSSTGHREDALRSQDAYPTVLTRGPLENEVFHGSSRSPSAMQGGFPSNSAQGGFPSSFAAECRVTSPSVRTSASQMAPSYMNASHDLPRMLRALWDIGDVRTAAKGNNYFLYQTVQEWSERLQEFESANPEGER